MKKEKQVKEEELESIRDGMTDGMAEKMRRTFKEKQEIDTLTRKMV